VAPSARYQVVPGAGVPVSSEAPMPVEPQVIQRSAAIGTSDSTMIDTAAEMPRTSLMETVWRCCGPSVTSCVIVPPDSTSSVSLTCAVSTGLGLSKPSVVSKKPVEPSAK
jgi:hypothetical protein